MTHAASDILYVGTYTKSGSKGIHRFRFNPQNARLMPLTPETLADNPTFLAVSRGGQYLYATGGGGPDGGVICAYGIGQDGRLSLLNRQPAGNAGPCHASVTPDGRAVFTANYHDGLIRSYPVEADGRLGSGQVIGLQGSGPDPVRQTAPHAHSVTVDPTGTFAVVADLGTDRLLIYRIGVSARLIPMDPPLLEMPPGCGPRHVAFHPDGQTLYLKTEMGGTVVACRIHSQGRLEAVQELSALPPDYQGEPAGADIHVHPSGRFLYCSNRGHDSITIFEIEPDGRLRVLGYEPGRGEHPRNFMITPDGRFLLVANMHSDAIEGFEISDDGRLSHIGCLAAVSMPSCLVLRSARG